MIPKVIHYCWFGRNEKSRSMLKCIESWKKFCPDYEIIEWNEDNFDIDCIPFVRQAYDAKKWAFVTDYARLKIVYDNGGIYLDTDVELIKKPDPLLSLEGFAGFEGDDVVATGLGFGAVAGHPMIGALIEDYVNREFPKDGDHMSVSCPVINTKVFIEYGLVPNGSMQTVKGITVFPREYFNPKDSQTYITKITDDTYSIHHYDATWRGKSNRIKKLFIRITVALIGRDRYIRLKNKLK